MKISNYLDEQSELSKEEHSLSKEDHSLSKEEEAPTNQSTSRIPLLEES